MLLVRPCPPRPPQPPTHLPNPPPRTGPHPPAASSPSSAGSSTTATSSQQSSGSTIQKPPPRSRQVLRFVQYRRDPLAHRTRVAPGQSAQGPYRHHRFRPRRRHRRSHRPHRPSLARPVRTFLPPGRTRPQIAQLPSSTRSPKAPPPANRRGPRRHLPRPRHPPQPSAMARIAPGHLQIRRQFRSPLHRDVRAGLSNCPHRRPAQRRDRSTSTTAHLHRPASVPGRAGCLNHACFVMPLLGRGIHFVRDVIPTSYCAHLYRDRSPSSWPGLSRPSAVARCRDRWPAMTTKGGLRPHANACCTRSQM